MAEETAGSGKSALYGVIIVGLVILILLSIFTKGFGIGSTGGAGNGAATPVSGTADQIKALMDDDMRIGSDTAPVVMVEFSDFQCPFCRKFWADSFQEIKKDYIDTGKVQLVYRDFPLSFHPSAMIAAQADECADDQGKGWEMLDKMNSEQAKLGPGTVQFTADDLKRWASEIGLDSSRFDSCLDSGNYSSEVQDDFSDGSSAGVRGTPSFILAKRDGSVAVPLSGALPYSTFKSNLDQLLQ